MRVILQDEREIGPLWTAISGVPGHRWAGFFLVFGLLGCHYCKPMDVPSKGNGRRWAQAAAFVGSKAGDEREIDGVKLCWCPPGRFRMGSPPNEPDRRPDEAQVDVTLTQGFWMGKYEVTQVQWKRIIGALPGDVTIGEGDDFPVHSVSYIEAEEFCRELTACVHASGEPPKEWEFRLPTEAQWEYACRAGTTTATAFGDKLSSKRANFGGKPYNGAEKGPSLNRAVKVGRYPPNGWGLHDMHGNAFEWCRDWYHATLTGGDDPDLSSAKGTMNLDGTFSRVRRGGAWNDDGKYCRSAFRLRYEPERRSDHIGFRAVVVRK
jgi:formylglycine-generating enzyme